MAFEIQFHKSEPAPTVLQAGLLHHLRPDPESPEGEEGLSADLRKSL